MLLTWHYTSKYNTNHFFSLKVKPISDNQLCYMGGGYLSTEAHDDESVLPKYLVSTIAGGTNFTLGENVNG